MNDGTEDDLLKQFPEVEAEDEIEIVEPRKPNRHERRKRAKLARMLAMKEKLEAENRRKEMK